MPREQKINPEVKTEVVRRCLDSEISISAAAKEVGVCFATLQRWMAQYEMEGVAAFLPNEHNRIYDPDVKLRAVQDYLAGGGSQLAICKKIKFTSRLFSKAGLRYIMRVGISTPQNILEVEAT